MNHKRKDKMMNQKLEAYIIGQILQKPDYIFEKDINKNWFYYKKNQVMFKIIKQHIHKYKKIRYTILLQTLKEMESENLDDGSKINLSDITAYQCSYIDSGFIGGIIGIDDEIKLLCQLYQKRKIYFELRKAVDDIQTSEDVEMYIENLTVKLQKISYDNIEFDNTKIDYIKAIEDLKNKKIDGHLNQCKGMHEFIPVVEKTDYMLLAARPSVGKTSFAVSYMFESKLPTLFISIESHANTIIRKILSSQSKIDLQKFKTKKINELEYVDLLDMADRLNSYDNYLIDDVYYIEDIAKAIRYHVKKYKVKQVIIDYIQLIQTRSNIKIRNEEIGYINRMIKELNKKYQIFIIALCQLARKSEDREKKRPQLRDLRDSGNLEQDADIILFLNRDTLDDEPIQMADIIIGKNREGRTGNYKCNFEKACTLFYNI